jgi:hypothetical protein
MFFRYVDKQTQCLHCSSSFLLPERKDPTISCAFMSKGFGETNAVGVSFHCFEKKLSFFLFQRILFFHLINNLNIYQLLHLFILEAS